MKISITKAIAMGLIAMAVGATISEFQADDKNNEASSKSRSAQASSLKEASQPVESAIKSERLNKLAELKKIIDAKIKQISLLHEEKNIIIRERKRLADEAYNASRYRDDMKSAMELTDAALAKIKEESPISLEIIERQSNLNEVINTYNDEARILCVDEISAPSWER